MRGTLNSCLCSGQPAHGLKKPAWRSLCRTRMPQGWPNSRAKLKPLIVNLSQCAGPGRAGRGSAVARACRMNAPAGVTLVTYMAMMATLSENQVPA